MKLNLQHPAPVKVTETTFQQKKEFTYLDSIVSHDGTEGNDIKNHLSKARNAFRMMNNVWRSSQTKEELPHLVLPFFDVRDELSVCNGIVIRGEKWWSLSRCVKTCCIVSIMLIVGL